MNVLFLVQYPEQAPSPRYRVYQLVPYLESIGIRCDVRPLIGPENYATSRQPGNYLHKSRMLARGLRERIRLTARARNYDLVYVLKGAFPYGPPLIERRIRSLGVPLIFDFDDAIHIHKPSGNHRLLDMFKSTDRVTEIVSLADRVVVPNEYLAGFARRSSSAVSVVPEAEDTQRLTPRALHRNDRKIVIGWVGSPSTAKYLRSIEPALRAVCSRYPQAVLRVIGGNFAGDGVPVECVPWRFEKEREQFHGLDIGIMPLPLEEWSRGKSGCKLRQYMATGVPGVGTAIGYNCELVENGRTGFLATSQEEWVAVLSRLIEDAELRNRIAAAARDDVEKKFALHVIGPRLAEVIRTTAQVPDQRRAAA